MGDGEGGNVALDMVSKQKYLIVSLLTVDLQRTINHELTNQMD